MLLYLRQRIGEWLEWGLGPARLDALSDFLHPYVRKYWPCRKWPKLHLPVPDHCGLDKHDYCAGCGTRTPGKARRPRS